jgi:hypothetical protein
MTEHYTDHDPARGCGCMLMLASAAFTIAVIVGFVRLIWPG